MRKLFTSVLLLISASLFAQPGANKTSLVLDTLDQYFLRSTSYVLQQAAYGGYAMGTGYFFYIPTSSIKPATTETGMHFDAVGSTVISEVLVWFGSITINGTPDFITAKIYTVGADTMPTTTVLGSTFTTTDLLTPAGTPVFTSFHFSPAVPISSAFFASIVYANDDTIGIFGNNNSTHDGLGEQRLRQKTTGFLGGNWQRPTQLWTNLDADAFIIPVVGTPTGMEEITNDNYSLQLIYPSMANDMINLSYELKKEMEISYRVFDITGKNLIESAQMKKLPGKYLDIVDINKIAAGKYYLTFYFNGQPITQSFLKSN